MRKIKFKMDRRFSYGMIILCLVIGGVVFAGSSDGNWPQFRGVDARGIAEGQSLPVHWDGASGANIKWRTSIPGLGHSSPVIWGDKLFITSAVGEAGQEPFLRVGLYGESPDNPEDYPHDFKLYCLDKETGEILWEQTAVTAVPQVMRHIKSSHATSSPVTDGKHVVVFFGSEGLYCYDMEGSLIWEKDLGLLDAGAFNAPEIRWGFGTSPVIYEDKVITLCDVNNQSFIAVYDIKTGNELWRTNREEVPTWGTPTIITVDGKAQIIANGWKHRGAYDLETGEAVWWMDGGGDIPVPTPFLAHGLLFFSSAHGRMRPLYAIRPEAVGDISLPGGESSSEFVAWSNARRGAYIPTPLVYGDLLYVIADNGALTTYNATSGMQVYRERAGSERGSYSASLVAGDDKVYCTSEYGDIHVIQAGSAYIHLATNKMGEICMATPAISGKTMYIRTHKAMVAVEDLGHEMKSDNAVIESAQESVKLVFNPPDGPLTDPQVIIQTTDAAAKSVQGVSYSITWKATGGLAAFYPQGTAQFTGIGLVDGFPEKFLVEADVTFPNADVPVHVVGGSDGEQYYIIDDQNQSVHADLDLGVMGRYIRAVLGAIVTEFIIDEPFDAEIACEHKTLSEDCDIAGQSCYSVHLNYGGERESETTWIISKTDYLPRGRIDIFKLQNGEMGGTEYQISDLVANPDLDDDLFKMKIPEGYSQTDQPVR